MKNRNITLLYFFIAVLLVGCQSSSKETSDKMQVVTTTGMIYDIVVNIGGDRLDALPLMGPGVDPHLYKATQGDLTKLREADVILYNGLHLEGKMGEVFGKLSKVKPVFPISRNIPDSLLRESQQYPGTFDPHIWFDIQLWKYAVKNVADILIEQDSTNGEFYEQAANLYLNRLDSLHDKVSSSIASIPEQQRVLITAHDAFGYFGEAYNIEVKGLQGLSTLSEPGLKDISLLVEFIVSRKIKAVFVETSVSEKAINAVVQGCKERGHEVAIGGSLYSDAMGPFEQPEGTYLGMVDANVYTIVNALK